MKLQENIQRIMEVMNLNEVKNMGLLYHYTKIERAEKIMESNKLRGSLNEFDDITYKVVSLTRNRDLHNTEYYKVAGEMYFVRFALDSEKLSQRYKMRPTFTYFEKRRGKQNFFGAEESVITDEIFPLTRYLVKIEIIKPLMDVSLEKHENYHLEHYNLDKINEFIKKYDVRLIDLNNREIKNI
jgi:hypothetical protein